MNKFYSAFYIFVITGLISCSKNDDSNNVKAIDDATLFAEISKTGYVYYKTDTIAASGPHKSYVLVRFNPTAVTALNSNNVLESGKTFPEGSIVVKEMFDKKGGTVTLYAVAKKQSTDPNSVNGWLWAEYNPNGSAAYSVTLKGAGCASCHGASPNRDFIKFFDSHP